MFRKHSRSSAEPLLEEVIQRKQEACQVGWSRCGRSLRRRMFRRFLEEEEASVLFQVEVSEVVEQLHQVCRRC